MALACLSRRRFTRSRALLFRGCATSRSSSCLASPGPKLGSMLSDEGTVTRDLYGDGKDTLARFSTFTVCPIFWIYIFMLFCIWLPILRYICRLMLPLAHKVWSQLCQWLHPQNHVQSCYLHCGVKFGVVADTTESRSELSLILRS
jgi:hypothetical protein